MYSEKFCEGAEVVLPIKGNVLSTKYKEFVNMIGVIERRNGVFVRVRFPTGIAHGMHVSRLTLASKLHKVLL